MVAIRHSEDFWKRIDRLREYLGDEQLLEALISAMSDEEAVDYVTYIEQMWEISDEEEEEEF